MVKGLKEEQKHDGFYWEFYGCEVFFLTFCGVGERGRD